jgi:hypothetical protein
MVVVFFIVLFFYSGWVVAQEFNELDDFPAYFVFPAKMLQTGSMGPDPFSERKVFSSLGGQSFLHTIILSMLSEKNLHLIDPGLGIIIIIGLLLGYARDKNLTQGITVLILFLYLLISPPIISPPRVNITPLVITTALFISFFRILDWEELQNQNFAVNAFIIALLAAAICSLKTSFIPVCFLISVLSYLFYIIEPRTRKKAIYEFIMYVILTVVFLLPWMITMHQSSGTLLYPLFGKGYHGSAYGTFLSPWSELTFLEVVKMVFKYLIPSFFISFVLLNFACIKLRCLKFDRRSALMSFSIGTVLSGLILFIASQGDFPRYIYPFMFAAIIVLIMAFLANTVSGDKGKPANSLPIFIFIFAAGILIGSNTSWDLYNSNFYRIVLNFRSNINFGLKGSPLISDDITNRYIKMQQSIPPGETIITRLSYPFLLDFKRNKIFIVDQPGGSSPPPGMPFFKGPGALADYLISKSIRYIAYSYADEANFPKARFGHWINPNYWNTWNKTQARHTFDFQENLEQLGKTRKRIFDDGKVFVIDLLNLTE